MCTSGRFITNRYTGHSFFVKCGKCPACLQEKANRRTNRVRCELQDGYIALFVTLTYNRFCCPYVCIEDVNDRVDRLPIYRESDARFDYRKGRFQYYKETSVLDYVYNPCYDDLRNLKPLAHRKYNLGVIYYPDIQNFHKRLNINLKRKYKYYESYKTFNCSEYGESSHRPHFHCLLFIKKDAEQLFRTAICEAWPFASKNILRRGIEVARNAASYVSSYVNSGSDFPNFLKTNFKPKHSFSKGLGMGLASFQLDTILQKIDTGDLRYLRQSRSQGLPIFINLPIPKYVINRYFPLFKGYSRIIDTPLHDLLLYPRGLFRAKHIDYSEDDIKKIHIRLQNAYKTYFKGRCTYDIYLLLYDRAWSAYRSTIYRHFMEDDAVPLYEKYDNIFLSKCDDKRYVVHPSFDVPDDINLDPNSFGSTVHRTNNLTQLYHQKLKTKTVNNICMSNFSYYY